VSKLEKTRNGGAVRGSRAQSSRAARPGKRNRAIVGQIGLGIMGGAFAKHLREARFDVFGFDVDPKRRADLKRLGGTPEASVGAVTRKASVLITSLPSVAAVDAVFYGAAGVLESAAPGTIVIEASTLPLEVKLALRDRCAARKIRVLDCPISGTGAQAAVKDISVYASGPRDAFAACEPIFSGFARSTHYCGEFGNGSKLKFIANLLVTIHNLATAEAIVLGRRSGLDLDLLYTVIRDGAGTSRMFEVRAPLMMRRDYAKATMKVDVYQKDIDIIGAYAAGLHCPTPLFDASKSFYAGAHAQGHAAHDTAAICAVLENMAGLTDAPTSGRKVRGK
jgi:3-hydroxyisobutyrate dehydrogenase-like beta-hydroxyacid dehydrogenase